MYLITEPGEPAILRGSVSLAAHFCNRVARAADGAAAEARGTATRLLIPRDLCPARAIRSRPLTGGYRMLQLCHATRRGALICGGALEGTRARARALARGYGQAPVAASEAIIILSSRDRSGVFGNCMELINTNVTLLYLGCNRVYTPVRLNQVWPRQTRLARLVFVLARPPPPLLSPSSDLSFSLIPAFVSNCCKHSGAARTHTHTRAGE